MALDFLNTITLIYSILLLNGSRSSDTQNIINQGTPIIKVISVCERVHKLTGYLNVRADARCYNISGVID